MGKKKAILILKGSLRNHWIKYITQFHLHANPTNFHSVSEGFKMLNLMNTIDSKYLQPGFSFKFDFIKNKTYNDPSLLHLKFVNGQERKYDLNISAFPTI